MGGAGSPGPGPNPQTARNGPASKIQAQRVDIWSAELSGPMGGHLVCRVEPAKSKGWVGLEALALVRLT